MKALVADSVERMRALGAALGRSAEAGDVLLLRGALGSGKTELVRGLAGGLGCEARIRSPTFNLIHRLEGGRLLLHHLDLYRIRDARELEQLGLDEAMGEEGVAAVEWSERLREFEPTEALCCDLSFAGDAVREIAFAPRGLRGAEWARQAFGEEADVGTRG
ncbi:MAG: tRNA (adenosine(37)-N6)-threonylcarbamoyltransferase complex ATPase subunit type 1 TsaE [Gemmatimonadetes bacterium]|nr:tRNA (adenosine(37)-N6)-threonylcarbamoyltransferase complex ATPase subunit type 1 TsaE [Gemmatimonadota bacterium]